MAEIRRIFNYTIFILKQWFVWVFSAVSIIEFIFKSCGKEMEGIPHWAGITLFLIGFTLANYKAYRVNAPGININIFQMEKPIIIRDYSDVKINFIYRCHYNINNCGNNAGFINQVDFSDPEMFNVKDEFVLSNSSIELQQNLIATKELHKWSLDLNLEKRLEKFPRTVKNNDPMVRYLILDVVIKGNHENFLNELLCRGKYIRIKVQTLIQNDGVDRKIVHILKIRNTLLKSVLEEYKKEQE